VFCSFFGLGLCCLCVLGFDLDFGKGVEEDLRFTVCVFGWVIGYKKGGTNDGVSFVPEAPTLMKKGLEDYLPATTSNDRPPERHGGLPPDLWSDNDNADSFCGSGPLGR